MDLSIILIFVLIYVLTVLLSATKAVPLSVAALCGALLTAWFGLQYDVFTYEMAASFIDVRLLGLIIGTMIVVEVAEKSGLFRFGALYAVKISKGNPGRLFVFLCVISAAVSLFLSDPTAMLLMAAATVTISKLLNYDPIPYFLSATIMINLGGTSTLIGSTSNMVIGLAAGIGFNEFIAYLAIGEVALWIITILALYLIFRKRLGRKKPLPEYNLVLLFLVVDNIGVGPEAVGLGCAILALILSNTDPAEIFKRLDWETVFFIAGFMFLMGGIQETGILNTVSDQLFLLVGGNSLSTTMTTLWFSGLASALVSNVAVALTFVPIINNFSILNPNLRLPVSSALIFGTNLGGATTPLSGSVPMMAVGTLKREGISMSFSEFTKIGLITSIIQLAFASLYIIARFGLGG
jgi:Na+/H+ antiporter NhaD/arsenite permease-like protein